MENQLMEIITSIDIRYVFILSGILLCYLVVRPIAKWIVAVGSIKLLSYLISSLVVLVVLLSSIISFALFSTKLLQTVLQCLGIFGGFLVLLQGGQSVYRLQKKKRV